MADTRHAQKFDIQALARLLTAAFAADPVMRWLIPDNTYDKVAPRFFREIVSRSVISGECITTQQTQAVAIWQQSDQTPAFTQHLFYLIRVLWAMRRYLGRSFHLQKHLTGCQPSAPYVHLTYLAAEPSDQGKGLGSALLSALTSEAKHKQRPVYLECTNEKNVSFYRAHGFDVTHVVQGNDIPTVWCMLNEC